MRPARLLFAAALTAAALAGTPALAAAVPPPNDNYLASTRILLGQNDITTSVDTTEATTQGDIFNPNASGQELGGGPVEPTTCNGASFGKTVWYDIAPPTNYGMQLRASAAFPVAIAIYEWSARNSQITRTVTCSANATAEDLLPTLEAKKYYTIQVGGVGGAGGPVSLKATFFPDSDNDGALDAIDDCRSIPGIGNSGCPPVLRVTPRLPVKFTTTGVIITKLFVERVPKGAKVVAKCSGCGSQTITAKKMGTVTLTRFTGRAVAAGKQIQVKVTMRPQGGTGKYRNGATGLYRRWTVRAGGLKTEPDRCINAKTSKIERCK
jgi:hypothetical protein